MDKKDSENGISDIQKMEMVIQKMDKPRGSSHLSFTLDKPDKWKMDEQMAMMENEMWKMDKRRTMMENEMRKKEKECTKFQMDYQNQKMDKATRSSRLNFTLAAFLAGGGLARYVKVKSMPSLIAGFGLSALYAGSGVLNNNGSCANGHLLAFFTSVGLVGEMGPKAIKFGGKPMPTALSVVGALAAYYNFKEYKFWLIEEHMAPLAKKMQEQSYKINKQMKSSDDTLKLLESKLLESIRRRSNDDDDQFDQTRIVNNNNDNEVKNEQFAKDIK